MRFYGDRNVHQTTTTGSVVGFVYALTIVGVLHLCIWAYPIADFTTFMFVALFTSSLSFIVFSNQRYHTLSDSAYSVHRFSMIVRLWIGVYFAVLLLNFLTKSGSEFSRVVMMLWLVSTPFALMLVSILCRWIIRRLYSSAETKRTAIFIGFSDDAQQLAKAIGQARMMGIDCLGYFDNRREIRDESVVLEHLGTLEQAREWVAKHTVDMVFIGLVNTRSHELAPIVDALQDSVASIYFVPESRLFGMAQIQQTDIAGVPVLMAYETPFLGSARVVKRMFDVVFSLLILIFLSPVMVAIAIGVKLSSPGPVFFKQKRYGIAGAEIDVLKFRSMRNDIQDSQTEVKQATAHDARITRFGRFIRRTSLDELPQFINVLKGSMSIVGPRPHATQHNELYRKQIKGYMLRHKVKPGITGWAQINGFRGETDTLEKMQKRIEYDLYYIRNWSLKEDFIIVLRTILLIIHDRKAY
jgi:putative colanic acid biosynthesis UDP-glucose lipid carrier transferase